MSDAQNRILRILTDRGDLRSAMRRAAFLGMLSPYFGVKLVINGKEPNKLDKAGFDAIEASACGYEPFLRRFSWHTYDIQWGDVPEGWHPEWSAEDQPESWELVKVTEVYHEGFNVGDVRRKGCPMSIFVSKQATEAEGDQPITRNADTPVLGEYVVTEQLPACPLIIGNFPRPCPRRRRPRS